MGKGNFIDDTTDEEEAPEEIANSPAFIQSSKDNLEDELTEEERKAEDEERAIYSDNNFWNNASHDEEYDIDALLEELE